MATAVYGSRSIKRARRTAKEMDCLAYALYSVMEADHPMTIRGLFYRLVSDGVIPKTEAAYKSIVIRLATEMRLSGAIPYGWVADNTRWRHGSSAFTSLGDWLEESIRTYRLDLWRDQDAYVEVWLEKDALAGVVLEETDPWRVPLMVTRGYPSLTYLANCAAHIQCVSKPTYLYYFGDLDPSGVDIPRVVEKRLRQFLPDVEIHFARVAITAEQVDEHNLPTRPTKRTDTRANRFKGESVEVDALPPAVLRTLVRECIVQHIDDRKLKRLEREEALGRETLASLTIPE